MVRAVLLFALLCAVALPQCQVPPQTAQLNLEQVRSLIASGHADFDTYVRLLDLTPLRPKPGVLVGDFKKLLDSHPNDPRYEYLYGRALIGKDTPEAILQLKKAAQADPGNALTHEALAEIYISPNFKDEQSLLAEMREFRKLCPASPDGFRYLDHVKDPEQARELSARLRPLLETRTEAKDGKYWQMLWAAEFRSSPESDYPALRKRVVEDLRRLESLTPRNTRALQLALINGYRLTSQEAAAAALESKLDGGDEFVFKEERAWEGKHDLRTRAITPDEHRALERERAAISAEWIRKWPSSRFAWTSYLSSLPSSPNLSKAELERAGDRILELDRNYDFGWSYISEPLRVAQIWVRYGVRLKDCLSIAEAALAEFSRGPEEPNDLTATSSTARHLAMARYGFDSSIWDAMGVIVNAASQLGDLTKARSMLAQMEQWLADNQGRSNEPGSGYSTFQQLYTIHRALVAEAAGEKTDALGYYIKAASSGWMPDEFVQRALALWEQQGGSRKAWDTVTARPQPPKPAPSKAAAKPAATQPVWTFAAFQEMTKPLPEFALRDSNGVAWTMDKLRGKRTFINVWATWCGPCREELPSVSKLYELTKGRDDIQVISLNVDDENPGMIAPFINANHISFPVLVEARHYVMDLIGMLGIPQNWLVDRNGVIRAIAHGFDDSIKDWPARLLERLEQLK